MFRRCRQAMNIGIAPLPTAGCVEAGECVR